MQSAAELFCVATPTTGHMNAFMPDLKFEVTCLVLETIKVMIGTNPKLLYNRHKL